MSKICIFSIAYGRPYIDKLFGRCAPSLMTPGNLGKFVRDDVSMVVGTLEEDIHYLRQKFLESPLKKKVNVLDILALPKSIISRQKNTKDIQKRLLQEIVTYFVRRNLVFFHAPPDCIFSDDTIYNQLCLHQISGKIVAIFNGRTQEVSQGDAVYLDVIQSKNGVKNFFFNNYSQEWAAWRSGHPDQVAGARAGHAIYQEKDRAFIFCNKPNPSVGLFTHEDLAHFVIQGTYSSFDNNWLQLLIKHNRLLVQTNLDMGMSIEPDPVVIDDARAARQRKLDKIAKGRVTHIYERADVGVLPEETLRRRKFDDVLNMICFSTKLD